MENMAENTTENKEENNKNGHDTLKKLKNIAKGIGGTMLFAAGIVTVAVNPVIGIPITILGASEIDKRFSKKMQMEGNLFAVGTYREGIPFVGKGIDNFIMMEPRSLKSVIEMICAKIDITQMVKQHSKKNKLTPTAKTVVAGMNMNYQMLDLLSCLEKCDKNGERITYNTVTHGPVISALEKLQKLGFIENLTIEPKLIENGKNKGKQKEKSLLVEEMMLGNFSNFSWEIFYNKEAREKFWDKRLFFNVSFNLTDKVLTPDTAKELLEKNIPRSYVAPFLEKCSIEEDKDGSVKRIGWKMELGKRAVSTLKKVPTAVKKVFARMGRNTENSTPNLDERSNEVEQVAQTEVDKAQAEQAKEEALRWTLRGQDPNDPNRVSKYKASQAIAEQAHEENSREPVVELARDGEDR